MKVTDYEYDRYEKISGHKRKWKLTENKYTIEGNTVFVVLSGIDNPVMICDLEDWERLKDYVWHRCKAGGYAITNINDDGKHRTVKFHQVVMGQKKGFVIDHINRNPLDNRKENLRFVTPQMNQINRGLQRQNTSGYKGVSWRSDSNKWRAQLWVDGKSYNIGCFDTKEEAIEARKLAEEKYHKPLFEV